MALRNVDEREGGTLFKLTSLEVGNTASGFVKSIRPSSKFEGQFLIDTVAENGEEITWATAGNLKYKIMDNKIQEGIYTEVTRLVDRKVNGKVSTQFMVAQDAERPLELATLDAALKVQKPVAPLTKASAKQQSLAQKAKMLEEAGE